MDFSGSVFAAWGQGVIYHRAYYEANHKRDGRGYNPKKQRGGTIADKPSDPIAQTSTSQNKSRKENWGSFIIPPSYRAAEAGSKSDRVAGVFL
jgi:hypothetical protein